MRASATLIRFRAGPSAAITAFHGREIRSGETKLLRTGEPAFRRSFSQHLTARPPGLPPTERSIVSDRQSAYRGRIEYLFIIQYAHASIFTLNSAVTLKSNVLARHRNPL